MAALATPNDIENSLGRSLSSDEEPRANALALLASAAVEAETRRKFAAGSYTVGRKVRDGKVILPGPVATIAAVRGICTETGAATTLALTTNYTVRGRTLYGLDAWSFVEVDYTLTATIPDEVVGVVAGIVAATISGPPIGASAQTAGSFSISYVSSTGKVWLSASDKAILRAYSAPRFALDLL